VSRVLVVDVDAPMLRTMDVNLRARGYEVQLARSAAQAKRGAGPVSRSVDVDAVRLHLRP
jgi:DNA-binding response OmpR family regulator